MKKAIGYVRRSTDKQKQSLDDQRKIITDYADKNGYELLRFYEDDAISGAITEKRNAFNEMINLTQGQDCDFDTILVYDISRFGRTDNDEAGYYRHLLRKKSIKIIYIVENLPTDDSADLLIPVKQ